MKVLIIGFGSIGERHARIFTEEGATVAVVSRREVEYSPQFPSLEEALAKFSPDIVLIANRTNEHYQTLLDLIGLHYRGIVLIEKPLFDSHQELPPHNFAHVFVTYNVRYHPIVQRLRDILAGENVLSVQAYVGQYLPNWRPQSDYRKTYSASKEFGGGALRDLSHDLDILNWVLGGWQRLTALGGQHSHLEIDSDDVFAIMMATNACPIATLQVNYLDRIGHRIILINTDNHTIQADMFKGTLLIDKELEEFHYERDTTYRLQNQAILSGDYADLCTLEQGLDVMHMIGAVEKAAEEKVWITR